MLNDVVVYILMNGINIFWWVVKIYYGIIDFNFIGEYFLVKLEIVLGMVLLFNKYVFFICKGNVIGIFRYISIDIVIFDFYVRNKLGRFMLWKWKVCFIKNGKWYFSVVY